MRVEGYFKRRPRVFAVFFTWLQSPCPLFTFHTAGICMSTFSLCLSSLCVAGRACLCKLTGEGGGETKFQRMGYEREVL
jgi:hypothetical protein